MVFKLDIKNNVSVGTVSGLYYTLCILLFHFIIYYQNSILPY